MLHRQHPDMVTDHEFHWPLQQQPFQPIAVMWYTCMVTCNSQQHLKLFRYYKSSQLEKMISIDQVNRVHTCSSGGGSARVGVCFIAGILSWIRCSSGGSNCILLKMRIKKELMNELVHTANYGWDFCHN